jgi:hypothetical protein
MLSLELVGLMGLAYAALVYIVVRTQLSKSTIRSQAEPEKSVWSRTRGSR